MNDENVISMANKKRDSSLWTPKQALEDALNDLENDEGYKDVNKILIVFLTKSDESYKTSWTQAGMSMSECVALCEVAKASFLNNIGCFESDH